MAQVYGNMDQDDEEFNVYFHADEMQIRYFNEDYKLETTKELKKHYLDDPDFVSHPVMELVMKLYAFLRSMEYNQRFKGFIKKKTEDMKSFFFMIPSVEALCSQEEIDHYKKCPSPVYFPEEIIIFTFITDVYPIYHTLLSYIS